MKRLQSIQLSIPNPCSQNWDEMTPSGNDRHCAHCSTTVIDFTTCTDAELYQFFAKGNDHVCGRYLSTQLDRPIRIPLQPHSRLYRMIVAMGLTLIFGAAVDVKAQDQPTVLKGGIKGHIVAARDEPMDKYSVQIIRGNKTILQLQADKNGDFEVPAIDTGYYIVEVSNDVWPVDGLSEIRIAAGNTTNVTIQPKEIVMGKLAMPPKHERKKNLYRGSK